MIEHVPVEIGVGVIALVVAAYGLVAARLSRYSVSAAFAFTVIGVMLGGAGAGMVGATVVDERLLGQLAEVTLALVLFSAASTVNIRNLGGDSGPVFRLLAIGLPLTIVAGTLLALGLFPGISLGVALLIATSLAPTDADLGQQVITDRSVPARVRRLLNVESGLNDGIAAPLVTVAIALATVGDLSGSSPVVDAIRELLVAAGIGSAVGIAGGWLLVRADRMGATNDSARKLTVLALAVGAYFLAVGLEGSGFIAAFAAGLGFGVGSRHGADDAVVFTEAQSVLLSIAVWLIFGLLVLSEHLADILDPATILYAVLAITALRMIPVAIALVGDHFDRVTVAFMGWFGPRGLASIVFALLGLEALEAEGVDATPLAPVVACTVLLSVVLHGFSAGPLARWYGRYASAMPTGSPEAEGDTEPRRKSTMWTIHAHHEEPTTDPPARP